MELDVGPTKLNFPGKQETESLALACDFHRQPCQGCCIICHGESMRCQVHSLRMPIVTPVPCCSSLSTDESAQQEDEEPEEHKLHQKKRRNKRQERSSRRGKRDRSKKKRAREFATWLMKHMMPQVSLATTNQALVLDVAGGRGIHHLPQKLRHVLDRDVTVY